MKNLEEKVALKNNFMKHFLHSHVVFCWLDRDSHNKCVIFYFFFKEILAKLQKKIIQA